MCIYRPATGCVDHKYCSGSAATDQRQAVRSANTALEVQLPTRDRLCGVQILLCKCSYTPETGCAECKYCSGTAATHQGQAVWTANTALEVQLKTRDRLCGP